MRGIDPKLAWVLLGLLLGFLFALYARPWLLEGQRRLMEPTEEIE